MVQAEKFLVGNCNRHFILHNFLSLSIDSFDPFILHQLWYQFLQLSFNTLDDCLQGFLPVTAKGGGMWRPCKNLALERIWTRNPDPESCTLTLDHNASSRNLTVSGISRATTNYSVDNFDPLTKTRSFLLSKTAKKL